jgi:hypothetical protein
MKLKSFLAGLAAVFTLSAVLITCQKNNGGTAGGTDGGITAAPDVSWGVMKKGSAIVNGVTFDVAGAQITHDDSPGSDSLLHDGMAVKVRGTRNADGVTGKAVKIETESEIQGIMTAKGVDSITVLGQQVFTDSRTVYANVANFQELDADQWVTVHGMRDQLGRLLATRIEVRETGGGQSIDRLKGVVDAPFTGGIPPALTFTLRGVTVVTARGTMIQPDGAAINPGDPVEVHGFLSGTTFTAGRIDREDLEDGEFEPRESEEFEVEGFVSGFTAPGADFVVNAITVRPALATKFEGGIAADLVNNVRVEVEGQMTGGVLTASKIRFDDTVRIRANADAGGSANVLGKTVLANSRTELVNLGGGVAGIVAGQGLRVRGFENPDGSVTATQLIGQSSPVSDNGKVVQGVVKAFDASARTITVLGVTFNAVGAAAFGPHDGTGPDHPAVSLDQFFSLLTADRTVVKAEGAFSPGPPPLLTAVTVEIE